MISRKGSSFLVDHYEWLVLGLAVAALAWGAVVFTGALGADPDEAASDAVRTVDARKPDRTGVAAVALEDYERAAKRAKTPIPLMEIEAKNGSFLASDRRVWCAKCQAPIPVGSKTCSFCGEKQPEEVKVVYDTDGDGMPDDWEKRYGLNLNDAADAQADRDGDGFSNLEEFEAKTDPTDAKSHPEYFGELKLVLPLKETRLPFYFKGVTKLPSGYRFHFFDPRALNAYGKPGTTYSVLAGEPIGKTGFSAVSYEQKSEKREIKGGKGMVKTVDVSTATLERAGDRKKIVLRIDEKRKPVDVQATISFPRGDEKTKTFVVVPGDTIDLRGETWTVRSITSEVKKVTVLFERTTTRQQRTLSALEP